MAKVHIVLGRAGTRSNTGSTQPVMDAVPEQVDTIMSSGTSQQADITVPNTTTGWGLFWQITVTGGNVWASFGADPTAAPESGHLLLNGTTREFGSAPAQKVAVIDE